MDEKNFNDCDENPDYDESEWEDSEPDGGFSTSDSTAQTPDRDIKTTAVVKCQKKLRCKTHLKAFKTKRFVRKKKISRKTWKKSKKSVGLLNQKIVLHKEEIIGAITFTLMVMTLIRTITATLMTALIVAHVKMKNNFSMTKDMKASTSSVENKNKYSSREKTVDLIEEIDGVIKQVIVQNRKHDEIDGVMDFLQHTNSENEVEHVSQNEDNDIGPLPTCKNESQDEQQQKQEITVYTNPEVMIYRHHDYGSLVHPLAKIEDVGYKDIKDDHNFPLPSFPVESLIELNVIITEDNSLPTEEPPPPLHAVIFTCNQININDKEIVVIPSPLPSHYIEETYEWMTKPHNAVYYEERPLYPRNVVITLRQVVIEEAYFNEFRLPHEALEMKPGRQQCIVPRMRCILVQPNSEMVVTKVV